MECTGDPDKAVLPTGDGASLVRLHPAELEPGDGYVVVRPDALLGLVQSAVGLPRASLFHPAPSPGRYRTC